MRTSAVIRLAVAPGGVFRRVALAAAFLAAGAAAALVDPDLRGPLASVADLHLAGHEDRAWERTIAARRELEAFGLSAGSLRLPRLSDLRDGRWPVAAPGAVVDPDALDRALDVLARDPVARHLFRAVAAASRGDLAAARAHARELARRRDTLFTRALLASLDSR